MAIYYSRRPKSSPPPLPKQSAQANVLSPTLASVLDRIYAARSISTTLDPDVEENRRREALVREGVFHRRLCEFRILDPACGSGKLPFM